MVLLTVRTDKPEAEIGLYQDHAQMEYEVWHAHRELSVTMHQKIEDLLARQGKGLKDIDGVVAFAGPGSFTGLRIGLSVANALVYGLQRPIVAVQGEENWIERGISRLLSNDNDKIALPEYGSPVHITQQRK